MKRFKAMLASGAVAALIGVGTFATPASAYVACNRFGDCWHTNHRYRDYPADLRIRFHSDRWERAHRHDHHYYWRDKRDNDRGFYDHDQWHEFDHH